MQALNYYTNEEVSIPLDPTLSAQENAKKYFDKYGKLKRTFEAVTTLLAETEDLSWNTWNRTDRPGYGTVRGRSGADQRRAGRVRLHPQKNHGGKKVKITSKPYHYVSSDGFDIYVGKNNFQNDELTFQFATGNDWWFHAKGAPGSHVIVKANSRELPDRTFEEAGRLGRLLFQEPGRRQGRDRLCTEETGKKARRREARFCGILYQLFPDD